MANKRIDKLANFDAFVNLEVLWINGNQIQELDGLDGCFRIKQLYAQNNCIRSLEGSSLPHFKFLRELRLYDNKLKDLQGTLEVLSRLSHLRDLDLFGNAVVEEENYRLQVIRAIPSLDVLDRHVITDEERAKAARLQIHGVDDGDAHGNQHGGKKIKKKQSGTVAGAPPQVLSGTVKMLFREVAAIKREQQARTLSCIAQRKLKRTQQQALNATSTSRRSGNNNNKAEEIPGLGDWEVTALKKHFQSLEEAKNRYVLEPPENCDSKRPPASTSVLPCNGDCKHSTPTMQDTLSRRASNYRSKVTICKRWRMAINHRAGPDPPAYPVLPTPKSTGKFLRHRLHAHVST
ncbi:hypothetical protein PHYSODRAFT_502063 [Phytophthora sojae]|uniref:U2A'/phosphoprotein 32 family A C-terminal domain-containing protein n=1 Tax=Phytophthora sojae (strain P6497) TaxID=1094619 RepID=G4ZFC8_PHYSP|nr:hypothetical protein PHYSODRAFT_502063 [Phytophthora sojae]EGZ17017.1 hypothetical protein PHYSODRAFT_502063 [Phytophthora sojae]|eukprot:XP_009526075.1 hypothetical protein PHYSODRAFT_502063 [Phytophthora sojae]